MHTSQGWIGATEMSSFPTRGIPLQSSPPFSSTHPTSTSIGMTLFLSYLRFALAWLRLKQQERQDLVLPARSLHTKLTFLVLLTSLEEDSLSLPSEPPCSVVPPPHLASGPTPPPSFHQRLPPSAAAPLPPRRLPRTPPGHLLRPTPTSRKRATTVSTASHQQIPKRWSFRR